MKQSFRTFAKILFSLAFLANLAVAAGFDQSAQNGFRYGPNLSWSFVGNTPFVWGQWYPQLMGNLHYTWLEPLDELSYGDPMERTPTYLKMEASVEASPFYGGYQVGLGIRPFKTNPQVEVNVLYESFLYFYSNLEMVNADVAGEGRIAESWNADYIADNVWQSDAATFDYAQLFDMGVSLEYIFAGGSLLGTSMHYILSDISTDFTGKSYDYKRNIPVFSRDFLIEVMTYGRVPLTEHFALMLETMYYRTGYLRSGGSVEKESLSYGTMMGGPHFSWNKGLQNITLEVGAMKRGRDRSYDGSLAQQFLVQLEYQGYVSFPFSRHFTK